MIIPTLDEEIRRAIEFTERLESLGRAMDNDSLRPLIKDQVSKIIRHQRAQVENLSWLRSSIEGFAPPPKEIDMLL